MTSSAAVSLVLLTACIHLLTCEFFWERIILLCLYIVCIQQVQNPCLQLYSVTAREIIKSIPQQPQPSYLAINQVWTTQIMKLEQIRKFFATRHY